MPRTPAPETDLRRSRSSLRTWRRETVLLLAGLCGAAFAGPPCAQPADAGLAAPAAAVGADLPRPPAPGHREAAATLRWVDGPPSEVRWRPGSVWRLVPETAVTGWLVRPEERREIRQTRLRIEARRAGKRPVLAWLQHTANTEVSILKSGDPRLLQVGAASDDSLRPWPNVCTLALHDLGRDLDLNQNGRPEFALRSTVTVPDPAASAILILEADESGRPRLVPPSEFVGTVRFDEGIITAIRFPEEARDPVLEAQFLPLYNCRFLSRLQVHGEEACRSCCLVPMVLRRDASGRFQPVFDRPSQQGLLIRLQADLDIIQQGDLNPLIPPEEAALCRAAAFFYLTGMGRATRSELEKALGPRASLPQSAQLLARLDRFFLAPAAPDGL